MSNGTIVLLGAGGQLGLEWQDFFSSGQMPFSAFTSAELDITDAAALERVLSALQPDVVINCAAYTKVDKAESESDRAEAVNATGVGHLARLARSLDFLLVHYSTDYVFGGHPDDSFEFPKGYAVDQAAEAQGAYGRSKWHGEQALLGSGCDFLLIRVAWLCGKHGQNFVKTMLRLGRERDELRVVDDQVGSPSFCENVVFNSWELISRGETGVFHIASTDACSWFELAAETLRWAGIETPVRPIPSTQYPSPVKRPHYSKLDISKTAAVPGIVLHDWKTGLHNLLHQLDL